MLIVPISVASLQVRAQNSSYQICGHLVT